MKYRDAVSFLNETGRFRINPSLENINHFFDAVGLKPRFRVIQISGTNGKTSTAVMTAALLSSSGLRTGLFLSPHVIHYGERFAIEGRMLSRERFGSRLGKFLQLHRQEINRFQLTEFEILTAFAVWLFNEERVNAAVMETGLGGRFDAVSALGAELGVITGIGIDHTGILGSSEEDIALEKLYPFAGKRAVFSPLVSSRVRQLAKEMSVKVIEPEQSVGSLSVDRDGTQVRIDGMSLRLPVCGREYAYNALTALTAAKVFTGAPPNVSALEKVFIPARFQQLKVRKQTVVIDGAHNEQAVAAVVETFREVFPGENPFVICGFMKDKDYQPMLAVLKNLQPSGMIAVKIPSAGARGLEPEKTGIETAPDIETAFQKAADLSSLILVVGSLYLAGDFLAFLNQAFKIEVEKLNYYIS